jgi:general secretion pathway protein F
MAAAPGTSSPFLYVAARPDGGRKVGVARATSARALSEQLRKQRLVALRWYQLPSWAGGASARDAKVRLKDQAEVHMQLAQLLVRGVPLVEALDVVANSVSHRTKPLVERVRDKVASGMGFADSAEQAGLFDVVTTAVYRASERTGDLAGAAKQLATTVRRQLQIQGKVATLMIYPLIVMCISLSVVIFMLTHVVPRVGDALRQMTGSVPMVTGWMMAVGEFLASYFLLVVLAALLVVFGLVMVRKQLSVLFWRVSRRVPIFREVVLAQESARFFTVMAAMTRSGVVLADALGVAVSALGHPMLKKQLSTLRTRLIEGGVLRSLINDVDALPISTRRLLIAAERAGDLESAFETLADDMTQELDRRSSRLLAALEPLIIVAMFAVIGSMVLAIMVPMIQAAASSAQ